MNMSLNVKLIFYVCLSALILSCKDATIVNTAYLIDLEDGYDNYGSVKLSRLGNKIEYIPLETDSSCLIRNISEIAVSDSFIFVNDGTRILQFLSDGSFVRQIGSLGRGPDQYLYLSTIQADEEKNELYVLSVRKMLVFGFEGKLRRTFDLYFSPRQFFLIDENMIVFHSVNLPFPPENRYSLFYTDRFGEVIDKVGNDLIRVNNGIVILTAPMHLYNNYLHFMEYGTDTMFVYNNDRARKPSAIFNLGNLKFPPDPLPQNIPGLEGIWVSDTKETDELILFSYNDQTGSRKNCIYDKITGDITVLENNKLKNDIDGGPDFWPRWIVNDKIVIDTEEAITMLTYLRKKQSVGENMNNELNVLINRIDENSNPILTFLR